MSLIRLPLHLAAGIPTLLAYAAIVAPVARFRSWRARRRHARPTILWGPTAIANVRNSVMADRLFGYESESLVYRVYSPSDRAAFDHVWEPIRLPALRQLNPYLAFLWAGFRYDVFCTTFDGALLGETPIWWAELPMLRLAGKAIVVYPYGGDARLPSFARAEDRWKAYTDVQPGSEDRDESEVRRRLAAFGRYANVM